MISNQGPFDEVRDKGSGDVVDKVSDKVSDKFATKLPTKFLEDEVS